jgi:hypothetical protein
MKMLFYPYILLSIGDFILRVRRSAGRESPQGGVVPASFLYARLLILVAVPWLTMSIWYVPEALGLHMEGPVELVYSILISWVGVYIAIRLEEPLEATRYRLAVRVLLWIAFLAALITYTGFAFHPPRHGFFVI